MEKHKSSKNKKHEYIPPVGPNSKSVAPIAEGERSVADEYAANARQARETAQEMGRLASESKEYTPPVGPGSKSLPPQG